jgi:hypothetical protein
MIYAFGALGGILFGYDHGVIAGALLFIRKDMMLSLHLDLLETQPCRRLTQDKSRKTACDDTYARKHDEHEASACAQ